MRWFLRSSRSRLGLLVAVLVVVHQLAHGRLSARHNLDQVKVLLLGQLQCRLRGHHAQLRAVGGNHAHLSVADFFVDHRLVDIHTPPK